MIHIALIGYGKMGKMIERIALDKGFVIEAIVEPASDQYLKSITALKGMNIDVCIDFSHPDCALENIKNLCKLKLNAVIGTTGWHEHLNEVRQWVSENQNGLIYGSNYSVGMNMFYRLIEDAVKHFNHLPDYDIFAFEAHHRQKADSPSGTAREISTIILNHSNIKNTVIYDKIDRQPAPEELHFASIRGGAIPGTHEVGFDSIADTIEIKHTARNREGFASGALMAAQWLKGKSGIYNFQSIFGEILNG